MKKLKIIDTGEVHFYSLPGLSYYTVTGMTKDGTEYNARREDIFSLLQQQAELTRAETIKEIVDIIEKYKLFAEDLHRGAHRDNLNMLLYDSHSRIVACDHILEKINQPRQ